jgi:hypothetical protein
MASKNECQESPISSSVIVCVWIDGKNEVCRGSTKEFSLLFVLVIAVCLEDAVCQACI